MDITPETPSQTHERLKRVMAHARMVQMPGDYTFAEFAADAFPSELVPQALAFVRDAQSWSALLPASERTPQHDRYMLLSFHFAADIPNSGFVGWLATQFKQYLGTGVFVVCGQNAKDGGIYDYWGIPIKVAQPALALVASLGAQLHNETRAGP
jgi:Family of unknown function (DUF6196)